MSNCRSLAWTACALLSLAGTASAQSLASPAREPSPVEVSPFVSTVSGDTTGVGAAIRWPALGRLGLEVDTEFRSGAASGLASSVNAVFDLPAFKRVTPYAVGGIGFERYDVADRLGDASLLVRRSTTASLNLGGGVRVPINQRWGFRADVRYSAPTAERAPERLRVFWGATVGLGRR